MSSGSIQELTAGVVRDVAEIRGLQVGIGGDVVFYGVPEVLQVTHDRHPVSYHVFVRVEPHGGRMWNMTMGGPINGHGGMAHGPP